MKDRINIPKLAGMGFVRKRGLTIQKELPIREYIIAILVYAILWPYLINSWIGELTVFAEFYSAGKKRGFFYNII